MAQVDDDKCTLFPIQLYDLADPHEPSFRDVVFPMKFTQIIIGDGMMDEQRVWFCGEECFLRSTSRAMSIDEESDMVATDF